MATRRSSSSGRRHGQITVILAKMSEDSQEIRVARGSTLKKVLESAGYSADQFEDLLEGLRVNGQEASLTTKLKAGDFITLSPRVQGGSR
jgi:hypothetical protein